ncbi:polysaccharide pyruvyl transferase CsaB [Keratinibaculum paraultunense]|uniref:Polysaccharide pyruvyl transferase CsaB n=1 Tax=Keratinibaculum paraultunense TaxID=1278232 RepID=A0A4R3KZ89_9FIRM|nr:polysaccharide pyruvyl transferase CsaB [Keratinibaculum paraultunense]QQY80035.1 polysaccharide pyruvyl transferase CsaB [Keratinibaculum paraultunense]TCS91644.1 polysaccharide pyruvyl transferase CsaB [Keratinibaculum paraultunense]
MVVNKKILVSGYYGFDNSGDDAILKAIVKDIKELEKNVNIIALSNNPSCTREIYNIDAVNRFSVKSVIKSIKDCDLFISGGGSLLQDVTSTRSLLYYVTLMKVAKLFNKPVMVYANGIGPINKKINRILTRNILNKVNLITLRDQDSKIFLKELGVKNENIYVTADPVFSLEPTDRATVLDILEEENIPIDKPLIGISIREWKNTCDLVENIVKAIDYIGHKYNVNVVLIPMHYPEDLSISYDVLNKVSNSCYILSNKHSAEDIMGIIRELEIIIAMRLHSLIYAASQCVPMVGLIYDPKIESFLKSINMNYMCKVEDMKYDELIENIEYVWNNREELRNKLNRIDKYMKEKAVKNAHMALELLKSR